MINHLIYLVHSIVNVKHGKKVWKKIKANIKQQGKDYVIIFPEEDYEITSLGVKYLKEFASRYKDRDFILVCEHNKTEQLLRDNSNNIIKLKHKKMKNLLEYYTACNFYTNMIIVSLTLPRGRSAERLINTKGITVDQIIRNGIFKLYEL